MNKKIRKKITLKNKLEKEMEQEHSDVRVEDIQNQIRKLTKEI